MNKLKEYLIDNKLELRAVKEQQRGAVIICPGGGYQLVSDREGTPIAKKFNEAGYHAFVLTYAIAPRKHPEPIIDLGNAIKYVRENAEKFQINPNKIAVCGFSAGGHLVGTLANVWDKKLLQETLGGEALIYKPNAVIMSYPVVTSGEFAHKGSFNNLLGADVSDEEKAKFSLETLVSENVPPTFLWHTVDDLSVPVENSLLYAKALRKYNVPFELHLFPTGPHGISLATEETADGRPSYVNDHVAQWITLCIKWLNNTLC